MTTMLNNGTVGLRALEPTDLDTLYLWENDAHLWASTDTTAPFSRQLLWQYLKSYTGDIYQSRQLRLMVTLADGTSIGTVDLYNFDPLNNRAEIGLYIAPEWRGHNYGHSVLLMVCDYAANHIGMRQLYAYIRTDNVACLSLFAQQGFESCGTLRAWVKRGQNYHDVAVLQRLF